MDIFDIKYKALQVHGCMSSDFFKQHFGDVEKFRKEQKRIQKQKLRQDKLSIITTKLKK